jgi:hypothetical protein
MDWIIWLKRGARAVLFEDSDEPSCSLNVDNIY